MGIKTPSSTSNNALQAKKTQNLLEITKYITKIKDLENGDYENVQKHPT